MRTLVVAFLVTLIVITVAPIAIFAGGEQAPQSRTQNGDHNAAVLPHGQVFVHNHNGHGHPHGHNVFQRIHNALFGRYHLSGTCTPVPAHHKTHGGHQSGGGVKHGPAPHGR